MHEKSREPIVKRLKRISGHVQGVQRMIEEGRDCPDILLQISAVRAALNQVGRLVLEDHLDTCIVEAVRQGEGEKALSDLKESMARFLG